MRCQRQPKSLGTLSSFQQFVHAGNTDEYVHNPLDLWPGTEKHVYHVPVATCESTETDESPVEGTNRDEEAGDFRHTAAGHMDNWERIRRNFYELYHMTCMNCCCVRFILGYI